MEKNKKTFEEALKRLEEIVERLELGDVSLEETVRLFEEGIELVNFCNQKLEEVKHKVEIIVRDKTGGFTLQPFDAENSKNIKKDIEELEDIDEEDTGELPF